MTVDRGTDTEAEAAGNPDDAAGDDGNAAGVPGRAEEAAELEAGSLALATAKGGCRSVVSASACESWCPGS